MMSVCISRSTTCVLTLLCKHLFLNAEGIDSVSTEYTFSMQMSPDCNPFIDRHPQYPNVVIGAGFSG